jgi:hypothetical protein
MRTWRKRDGNTDYKNGGHALMMTVSILSRRTTSGGPKASAACGAYRSRDDCMCGERGGDTIRNQFWSWLGLSRSAGLLRDIVLGRA